MRRFAKDNGLSLAFGALFLIALALQSIAGWHEHNAQELAHRADPATWIAYVTSADFGVAVLENWQSEYLQFTLFILVTVWLVQRGSPESKEPGKEGTESDRDQKIGSHANEDSPLWARVGGLRTSVFSNSLLLLMTTLWLASWLGQSLTGVVVFNEEQAQHGEGAISWAEYLTRADFWERTLQNWQSELLAVGSMAIFAVYLRQRGSPESKPVGASHAATGVEG
ncbi:MAG TPA: DUF6766 family protein [Conexibacter sp.]|jgi:hypothetical protein|nr:DUF6766 family protein [Conexibacter sp.]